MDWEEEYNATRSSGSTTLVASSASSGARATDINTRRAPSPDAMSIFDEPAATTPLQQLIRHWMNERHAPTILPAQEQLLGFLLDHIRRQTDTVQALRGDPSTSEEEHIRIVLVQTEVEQVKFIVRSYIRTRLFKIEKFARFICTDEETQRLLTTAERQFAMSHAKNVDRHFNLTVLQSLPPGQAYLDHTHEWEPEMTTRPNRDRAVFAYALRACPPVRLPSGLPLEFKKNQLSVVPYHVVEEFVLRGDIELV
ncbi:GINS complex, Sld5 component [Hymenopellis radicata]|nr:GINS complex, Sld5 component [Hymenopellis radicata]